MALKRCQWERLSQLETRWSSLSVVVSEHRQDVGGGHIWAASKYLVNMKNLLRIFSWHIWAAWSEVELVKCFTQARCPMPFVTNSMPVLGIRIIISTRLNMGMRAGQQTLKNQNVWVTHIGRKLVGPGILRKGKVGHYHTILYCILYRFQNVYELPYN